ncbi:hypothetical protein DMH18_26285 [Streptomyces sp. WAC 06783]|uniref:hypothetical protein n=1 Tax=Streptomyces sp. WAC 06783 TaxID=2203211 RepID=UPI000F73CE9F|nr:hypothetical protein [Streptomyces sp. WAC 06783]RSO06958.1 hypothetical protein DMH18_26285 [Streptomyces sp. WAC 06783]
MPDPDTRDLPAFAAALADRLPGSWTSEYHQHEEYDDQFPTAAQVWDMNLVSGAIAQYVLRHHAVLTHEDGTRLYLIDRPGHPGEHLVGALAPPDIDPEAFRGVREPDGIAVSTDVDMAAEDVHFDLLPRYAAALAKVQHNAAHPPAPPGAPAPEAETVVMTWYGDGLLAAKATSQEAAKALRENGFTYDPAEHAFVLPGDDTAHQARCVRNAGQQLDAHGIGVTLRHPPKQPALDATPPTPAKQPNRAATHSR